MAGISAAFYWDPRIRHNAHAYHSLTFKSHHPSIDSSIPSTLLDPLSLVQLEDDYSTADNISLLLRYCPIVYTYSSTHDFVLQLSNLSKSLANQSLDSVGLPFQKPSVFLLFCAIDVLEIDRFLPVLRFISFIATHFPAVLTVLYEDNHSAAALAASRAPSLAGPITKPSSCSDPSNSLEGSADSASATVSPVIDTSAHIYHTLKTCGVAVFSPPKLSKQIVETVVTKAVAFSEAEAIVVAHVNQSIAELGSAGNKFINGSSAGHSNNHLNTLSGSSSQSVITRQIPALFSNKFDYAIVNFITYLEIYHACHLLHSDEIFSNPKCYFKNSHQASINANSINTPGLTTVNTISPNNNYNNNNNTRNHDINGKININENKNNINDNTGKNDSSFVSSAGSFDPKLYPTIFHITQDKINLIASLIGDWNFPAHGLSYNDLLFAAFLMFKHAFTMQNILLANKGSTCSKQAPLSYHININSAPAVADLVISDPALLKFLLVVRDSYRPSNPYHNYRHAIDVLQATFYFMIQLNSLPTYSKDQISHFDSTVPRFNPSISILDPTEALTLLVVAIGHDVGHPGITNAFLSTAKTQIADAFNYKSILESYHSAAFQRILEIYWPATQACEVFQLITRSVQATDMGLHFDYMKKAEQMLEETRHCGASNYLTDLNSAIDNQAQISDDTDNQAETDKTLPDLFQKKVDFQTLVSCLLIKCADISNVTRPLEISSAWGVVLTKEFAQVEVLEIELKMKEPKPVIVATSTQPTSPDPIIEVKEDGEGYSVPVISLAKGQLFFINTFARPLFDLVSKLFPELAYTIEILESNHLVWKNKLSELEGRK